MRKAETSTKDSELTELIRKRDLSGRSLDSAIEAMAQAPMSEVVRISEGRSPHLAYPGYKAKAMNFLVARMFTDAIFNSDIRAIQQIINRIDGGLPKDTEVASYRTSFGDCINRILEMESSEQCKIMPDDTVMMAMSKELFMMAIKDIYWNHDTNTPRKPTTEAKNERDTAMRIVLERAGGRKTKIEEQKVIEEVGVQEWIKGSLPE